ncbi:MAG TPA: hypothetical protein VF169_10855 [Albitalea sp.]|uniref:hypothetical protein n=1 Tax=Piscinibacter sp. TaxID=1903157 RepID=UPI002ED36556
MASITSSFPIISTVPSTVGKSSKSDPLVRHVSKNESPVPKITVMTDEESESDKSESDESQSNASEIDESERDDASIADSYQDYLDDDDLMPTPQSSLPSLTDDERAHALKLCESAMKGGRKSVDGLKPSPLTKKSVTPKEAIKNLAGGKGIDKLDGKLIVASGSSLEQLHMFTKHNGVWYCHDLNDDDAPPQRIKPSQFVRQLQKEMPDIKLRLFRVLPKDQNSDPKDYASTVEQRSKDDKTDGKDGGPVVEHGSRQFLPEWMRNGHWSDWSRRLDRFLPMQFNR